MRAAFGGQDSKLFVADYDINRSACHIAYTRQSENKTDIFFEFLDSGIDHGIDHGIDEDNITMRIAELEILDKITPEKKSLYDIAPQ